MPYCHRLPLLVVASGPGKDVCDSCESVAWREGLIPDEQGLVVSGRADNSWSQVSPVEESLHSDTPGVH